MQKLLASLNITEATGAVVKVVVFICGLVLIYAGMERRIDTIESRDSAQHIAAITAIATTRAERQLQVDAITARVVGVEKQQAAIEELLREMRAVSVRVTTLSERMNELRDDFRSIRDRKS